MRPLALAPALLVASLLAACDRTPHAAGSATVTSRDSSIALDLPAGYVREGSRDAWAAQTPRERSRRFSLSRRPLPMPDPARPAGVPAPVDAWENGCSPAARATDVGCIVDRARGEAAAAGRRYLIETGRLAESGSGGDGILALRADWLRPTGDTVRLEGAARDSAGLAELRRIALSMRAAP